MIRYILKRVVAALITIWFIMTLTFVLMYAIPGSPISTEKVYDVALQQALEEKFGLNKPLHERYVKCLVDYAHGDFGISYLKIGLTTNEIIASGFPYSLRIGIYASGLIVLFGIAAGILAALRQNRFVDRFLMVLSTLGSTIPSFVFATLYLFLFSKILGLVPAFGVKLWTGYIGPVLVTSVFSMAFVPRLMRTSMIEELNQDYIRTARAKGLREKVVIYSHAWRNALLPVITVLIGWFISIFSGSLIIEQMFALNGMGQLYYQGLMNNDFELALAIQMFYVLIALVGQLITDLSYGIVDPRVRVNK